MRAFAASVIKLEMPSLSPTMNEGNIVLWSKKEGDLVKPGDIICEIQTDKATVGFESQEEGYLARILIPTEKGKGIQVGQLIGLLVEDKKDLGSPDLNSYTSSAPVAAAKQESKPEPSKP